MIDIEKTVPASINCIGNNWFPQAPGGLDRYVYELAYSLAKGEDKIELCGVGMPSVPAYSPILLTNLAQPDSSLWQRLWQARRNYLLRRNSRPDAINLHFALYSLPLLNQFPTDIPITFHFHGPWALESEQECASLISVIAKRWIEQRVYRRCDRFIVLSKAFGQILHQQYQIPWPKIHVIPGGVDTEKFQPTLERQQARDQLGWPQDCFVFFTPRRLVHRMGLEQLLEALAVIKPQHPKIWLAIAGKGPLRASLEQRVISLGLQENVRFLGFLPEAQLPVAYQAADLTIMPSQALEGFGLVLLESLACGTPALCTPVGGMPEVLTKFSPGLITASIEARAITQTLELVISGQLELPSRLSCRNYAAENFSWLTIAQQVRTVLLAPV